MPTSDDGEAKLPIIRPMGGKLTGSGLEVYVKGDKKESGEFIYFPSITYANRGIDRSQVNTLAYGTHDIIKLLVSGGVPPFVFQKEYWNRTLQKHIDDAEFKYRPKLVRKRELWEPKVTGKILNAQIDMAILEARLKQRLLTKKISQRADEIRARTDEVWRKRAEKMDNRVKAFVEKMEKRSTKNLRNRKGQ